MERPWLVLLLVGCVLLAGCSLPGDGPADGGNDGDDGSYPQGWDADGLANASLAIQGADDAVAGEDFSERRVAVRSTTIDGETRYLVDVLLVHVDRDAERLMTVQRYYVVSNETAGRVVDSGTGTLDDRSPDEVKRTYFNSSGGLQYHRLGPRSPRVTPLQSGDFSTATDQPLPAIFVDAVPMLEGGTYTDAESSDGGVTYSVEDASGGPVESGSGHVTVERDGLVPEFSVTQTGPAGPAAFTYELERGDTTVEPPDWNASSDDGPGTNGTSTATPGTATPTATEPTTSGSGS